MYLRVGRASAKGLFSGIVIVHTGIRANSGHCGCAKSEDLAKDSERSTLDSTGWEKGITFTCCHQSVLSFAGIVWPPPNWFSTSCRSFSTSRMQLIYFIPNQVGTVTNIENAMSVQKSRPFIESVAAVEKKKAMEDRVCSRPFIESVAVEIEEREFLARTAKIKQ